MDTMNLGRSKEKEGDNIQLLSKVTCDIWRRFFSTDHAKGGIEAKAEKKGRKLFS